MLRVEDREVLLAKDGGGEKALRSDGVKEYLVLYPEELVEGVACD